ncbi:MAG: hypothetical protein CM1200mP13_16010 [Candidatus Pelagibacterales bacterium]|nr:MAG: hypothetical protein CM1200mP13_16010 [Pelagibacterales bacterium]
MGLEKKKNKFSKLGINKFYGWGFNNLLNKYEDTTNNLKEGNISTGWIISENNKVRFRISIYILGGPQRG